MPCAILPVPTLWESHSTREYSFYKGSKGLREFKQLPTVTRQQVIGPIGLVDATIFAMFLKNSSLCIYLSSLYAADGTFQTSFLIMGYISNLISYIMSEICLIIACEEKRMSFE